MISLPLRRHLILNHVKRWSLLLACALLPLTSVEPPRKTPKPTATTPAAAASSKAPTARDIVYPADANVIDVKRDHGAVGDGKADDTEALVKAIRQAVKNHRTVYLPNGTYRVTKPMSIDGFWFSLQGQSRDKTVIKLDDKCPGFTDPDKVAWVLADIDEPAGWTKRDVRFGTGGGCNVGFFVWLADFTIDTGTGNPGAIALHYLSNNGGGLRNVTLRSGDGQGFIGLDLRRDWNGPCYFKDLTISGFDYGVVTRNWTYCSTFEDLTLEKQNKTGFFNAEHATTIRRLVSRNSVPAVTNSMGNDNSGPLVLIGANCSGGAAGTAAVDSQGPIHVMDLEVAGYEHALVSRGQKVKGPKLARWSTKDYAGVGGIAGKALDLPIQDAPIAPWELKNDVVSVLSFKPKELGPNKWEATEAIQKAIDAGKSTVYFPFGEYVVNKTIIVRGKVSVLQGIASTIRATSALKNGTVFRVETPAKQTVFFERFYGEGESWGMPVRFVEHAGAGTVVIRDAIGLGYRSVPGAGDCFLDSVCIGSHGNEPNPALILEATQKVWARDLNSEGKDRNVKFENHAADLWIMGLKTEGTGTILMGKAKARTESLGGLIYPVGGDWSQPAFVTDGGALSFVTGFFACNSTVVKEPTGALTYDQVKAVSDRFTFFSNVKK